MHLCIITSSFPAHPDDASAAAGLFIRDFACEMHDQGHTITVVTQAKSTNSNRDPSDIDVIHYPWLGGSRRISYLKPWYPRDAFMMISLFRQGIRTLSAAYKARHFDHILAMWAVPAGYMAMRLKRRTGVPYSVWSLGSDINRYGKIPLFRPIVKQVLSSANNRFANSEDLCEKVKDLCDKECIFLPSTRRFTHTDEPPADLSGPKPRFLYIGRYSYEKGTDVLVEAMAHYVKKGGTGSLYMLGDGPMRKKLQERIGSEKLSKRVFLGGFAGEREIVANLRACDSIVIPSRSESMPAVLSEALQFGKPLVVADVGDMGSIVRQYGLGHVVKPGDIYTLSQILETMDKTELSTFVTKTKKASIIFNLKKSAEVLCDTIISERM